MEVNGTEISKYGVVIPSKGLEGISGLIEKPELSKAPSNLASIGRYILTPEIFNILRSIAPGSGGEFQLADAINIQAENDSVETVGLKGKRFDCGSVDGFMAASAYEYSNRF